MRTCWSPAGPSTTSTKRASVRYPAPAEAAGAAGTHTTARAPSTRTAPSLRAKAHLLGRPARLAPEGLAGAQPPLMPASRPSVAEVVAPNRLPGELLTRFCVSRTAYGTVFHTQNPKTAAGHSWRGGRVLPRAAGLPLPASRSGRPAGRGRGDAPQGIAEEQVATVAPDPEQRHRRGVGARRGVP